MTGAGPARALFLVNPNAGPGRAEARLRRLLRHTRPLAGRYEVAPVSSVEDAGAALGGLEPGGIPVAVGGDGTASLIAAALRGRALSHTAMALLPLGTGNILARELGLQDPRRALQALEHGTIRRIDVMRTSHPAAPLALVSISGGFEGRFLSRYARLRRGGRPLAALFALSAAWGRSAPLALELDGEALLSPTEVVFSAGLYNTRFYAGGLVMSPGADVADGCGESIVHRTARAYWAALAAARRGGSSPPAGSLRRRWRAARLESRGPLQFDGEAAAGGSVSVWMEPGALAVVVPRP